MKVQKEKPVPTSEYVDIGSEEYLEDCTAIKEFPLDSKITINDVSYTMKKRRAEGSYGTVWLACSDTKTEVAIKIVNYDANRKIESLKREADILAEIKKSSKDYSTHIVEYIDAGQIKGPYNEGFQSIVMGGDYPDNLLSYLNAHNKYRENPISLAMSLKYTLQICEGVRFLHNVPGIYHRDLKIDNILVTENFKSVRICDFGVATRMNEKIFRYGIFQLQSPKILTLIENSDWPFSIGKNEDDTYNHSDEMYSFSVLVFEILTQYSFGFGLGLPIDEINFEPFFKKIVTEKKRPEIPADLPKGVSTLLMNGWHHDEKERPSFEKMHETLVEIKKGLE